LLFGVSNARVVARSPGAATRAACRELHRRVLRGFPVQRTAPAEAVDTPRLPGPTLDLEALLEEIHRTATDEERAGLDSRSTIAMAHLAMSTLGAKKSGAQLQQAVRQGNLFPLLPAILRRRMHHPLLERGAAQFGEATKAEQDEFSKLL